MNDYDMISMLLLECSYTSNKVNLTKLHHLLTHLNPNM